MKFQFLSIASLIITLNSFGQLEKKTWLVGGTGSLNSYDLTYTSNANSIKEKTIALEISPSIGYFLANKFAMGLKSSYSSLKAEIIEPSNGGTTNNRRFTVGPFLRYYFLTSEKQFNILAQASYQFGVVNFNGALKERGKINNFSFLAGPEIFFNSSVGLEILLGYKISSEKLENSQIPYKDERKGLLVSIGFQFHLDNL